MSAQAAVTSSEQSRQWVVWAAALPRISELPALQVLLWSWVRVLLGQGHREMSPVGDDSCLGLELCPDTSYPDFRSRMSVTWREHTLLSCWVTEERQGVLEGMSTTVR